MLLNVPVSATTVMANRTKYNDVSNKPYYSKKHALNIVWGWIIVLGWIIVRKSSAKLHCIVNRCILLNAWDGWGLGLSFDPDALISIKHTKLQTFIVTACHQQRHNLFHRISFPSSRHNEKRLLYKLLTNYVELRSVYCNTFTTIDVIVNFLPTIDGCHN